MPERTSITQVTQIGVEITPGTEVAANKRLRSASVDLSPDGNIDTFRPTGSKFPSIASLGKEWAGGGIDGKATYTEMVYFLSGLLGPATITTPGGGTNSRQWTWTIQPSAVQDPTSFTIEKGSSVRAHKAGYCIVNELGMELTREQINLTGNVLSRRVTDGITLTGSPTDIALIPILPGHVSVYFDTAFGSIGTTKLLRVLSCEWSIGNRFGTVWPLDSAQASWAAAFEIEPNSDITLVQEADATGMSHLTRMRNGDTGYLRIEAIGAIIEAAIAYRFQADFPVKVTEIPDFTDEDGIYAAEWGFSLFDDTAMASAGTMNLRNLLTAL